MTDTATERPAANGYRESAVNRWSMGVPVPGAEQRTEICDGPEHDGRPFAARTLRVFPARWGSEAITWVLAGPNIRQDGTTGKYELHRKVPRDYAGRQYPEALAALDAALHGLQALVRSDAEAACAQISRALPPPPALDPGELSLLRSYADGPRIWDAAAVLPEVLALYDRGLIEPAHGAAFRLTGLGRQALAAADAEGPGA